MKRVIILLCCAAGMIFLNACSWLSSPDSVYYDLSRPDIATGSVPIEVSNLTSITGEHYRMAYRKNGIIVQRGDFYKWIQPPGTLLTRYLRLAFRQKPEDNICKNPMVAVLSGEVLTFELNGDYAELGINYSLHYGSREYSKTVLLREKVNDLTAEGFVKTMDKCAWRFAKMVAAEADELARRK